MIIPALDLMNGEVVRLKRGDFSSRTTFSADPIARLQEAAAQGATLAHIVDLDGARDPQARQLPLLRKIAAASPIPIEIGGGIRTREEALAVLEAGVSRVVVGTIAVTDPEGTKRLIGELGADHVVVALDARQGESGWNVAIHGWQDLSALGLLGLLEDYRAAGLTHALVTDISRDGMMQGPSVDLYATLMDSFPGLDLIASGGIASLDDLRALREAGVPSAVLGRALLEGAFTVQEAVQCWQGA
ncbi:MAG: 1-(5-phosphoribosyl)-5-[(5-phosphoribosylamino)methylideneamino] imidazole-4-carboxamide isomerase [Succinivibrionaceae bacterium]|nr:1-(5-phosphoribosyl)-5-[(5-phosphoribosylamino)methylideneamino] imidazole-4-carboxamide isomerase [Succinivibrionaceae bacterium]